MRQFVKGLGVGAIIGTAAALLLAPSSGKDLRNKLTEEVTDTVQLKEEMNRNIERVQASLIELERLSAALLPPLLMELEQSLADFKFQADPRMTQIKEQIKSLNQKVTLATISQSGSK